MHVHVFGGCIRRHSPDRFAGGCFARGRAQDGDVDRATGVITGGRLEQSVDSCALVE